MYSLGSLEEIAVDSDCSDKGEDEHGQTAMDATSSTLVSTLHSPGMEAMVGRFIAAPFTLPFDSRH